MIVNINGKDWYYDKWLYENLQKKILGIRKKHHDYWLGIIGRTGCGKSSLGQQIGLALDPTLQYHPERICLNIHEFRTQVINANDGETVILDEAGEITGSSSQAREIREILYLITQLRVKKLNIIIILPSFFDLHPAIALDRLNSLIYCEENLKNGRHIWYFYSSKKATVLYRYGKTHQRDFRVRFWNRWGVWEKGYVINEEEYVKRKIENIANVGKKDKTDKGLLQRNALIKYLKLEMQYTETQICNIIYKYSNTTIAPSRIGAIVKTNVVMENDALKS